MLAAAACSAAVWRLTPDQPVVDIAAVGVICFVSSLLPDVDSEYSRPHDLLFSITSILVPVLVLQTVGLAAMTQSEVVIGALLLFILVRYGVQAVMQQITVHRGIFHSIPAVFIWGAAVFLAFRSEGDTLQNYVGAAAAIGYFVHLIVDELFSFVNFEGVRISPKQSFGTAIKFFAPSSGASIIAWLLAAVLLLYCLADAALITPFWSGPQQ